MKKKYLLISALFIFLYLSSFVSAACDNDGKCEFGETKATCPHDCGTVNYCGDGSCNNGETCSSCVADCGVCPPACTPNTYTACSNNDVYWYNSCNQRGNLVQDCGNSGYNGVNFCSNNDVYTTYITRGCSNSQCFANPTYPLVQDCGDSGYTGNPTCSNNDVYQNYANKGCNAGSCYLTNENRLKQDCGDSGYTGNNFCSNNDVYRNYVTNTCNSGACSSTSQNIIQQDCGEDTNSVDSDGGLFYLTFGTCTIGTDRGCTSGSCFANNGNGAGSDNCYGDTLTEYQTRGSFSCLNVLKNCNDYDNLSYNLNQDTCNWADYACGTGACQQDSQSNVDCDNYDDTNTDYFVTAQSCTQGCVDSDCCESQNLNYCGDGSIGGTEECDNGTNNGFPCIPGYGETCNWCTISCTIDQEVGPFCGDTIINGNEECDTDNLNGQTCEDLGFFSGDLSCLNTCEFDTEDCDVCVEDWQLQNTNCENTDTRLIVYLDSNTCGTTNNLPADNGTTVSCDFCTPNPTNTTWTDWQNTGCQADQMEQTRSLITYDANDCYAQTGLFSDIFDNVTITETQLVGPDYLNTTWSDWVDVGICTNNLQTQERYLLQYDAYDCADNITMSELQTVPCDSCTPNMVYTDWTDFSDFGCVVDQMNQTRTRIFFDENYCGEVDNVTETESQLVGPNFLNGTWSDWMNVGQCVLDNQSQSRTMDQYDSYGCAQDIRVSESQNVTCDSCTPNIQNNTWSAWANLTSCQGNNMYQQIRYTTDYDVNDCYAQTGLLSDFFTNNTYNETQDLSCDFCIPNQVYTDWTDFSDFQCVVDQMNQTRTRTFFDENYCGEVDNVTETESQLVGPNYVNFTLVDWFNLTVCLPGDYYTQQRTLQQYDTYGCAQNSSIFEQQNLSCTYNDQTAPVVIINEPLAQNYNTTTIPLNVTCTDDYQVSNIRFYIFNSTFELVYSTSQDGLGVPQLTIESSALLNDNMSYTMIAYCNDSANNNATPDTVFFTINTTTNQTPIEEDNATINGYVFNDLNQNGIMDAGEFGIADVTITLDGTTSTTTDETGYYSFTTDITGAHLISETNPQNYVSTTPDNVGFVVALGGNYNINFGDTPNQELYSLIYGTIFNDTNANGVYDLGETGISGVTITLDTTTNSTTNSLGQYSFLINTAGSHNLQETNPQGYMSTTPDTINLFVTIGNNYAVDFGDVQPTTDYGIIMGVVFNDTNANGIQDSNETGLSGVTMTLDDTLTATTGQFGQYLFITNSGVHTVNETNLQDYISSTPDVVTVNVVNANIYLINFGDFLFTTIQDTTPPNVTIINPENQNYNYTQIPVEFNCVDDHAVASMWYGFDGTNYTYTGPSILLGVLENTTYTLTAYCEDIFSNIGSASVIFSTNMSAGNGTPAQDLVNPTLVIVQPISQNYNYIQIPVEITCTDNVAVDSVWYIIDGTTYQYVGQTVFNAEENMTYTMDAYCNDTSNNLVSDSVTFSTNMSAGNGTPVQDLVNPTLVIVQPISQNYNYTQIAVEITCSDNIAVDSIWYIINGTSYVYTVPTFFNALENTTYTLDAYCNDTSNNVDFASVIFSTNMSAGNGTPMQDLVSPTLVIVDPQNQNYNSTTTILVEINCSDNVAVDSVWYIINGTTYSYSGLTTFNALENATYTMNAYCNDTSNNVVNASVQFSTYVNGSNIFQDLVNPTLVIVQPISQNYNYTQIPVEITCTDNVAVDSVWYVINGTTYQYSGQTVFNALENATYTMDAYCNDTNDNMDFASVVFSTNISAANETPVQDLDTPQVMIIQPENQNYNYTNIPVEITCNDAFVNSIWYDVNGGISQAYTGLTTFVAQENMTYRLNAYCNDSANHIDTASVVFSTNMTADNGTPAQDLDMPILTIIQPENNTNYNTTNVPLNITCTDIFGVDSVWFYLNSQARQDYTDTLLFVPGVSENHRFRLNAFCNDSVNHIATQGITFDIFPDSNVTNTTIDDNSTIDNSTVINSNVTNSTINNSEIIGVGCTIINSTLDNVKINMSGYCFIKNEYHANENITGYGYYSATGDPINNTITAWIFESRNSTYNFNIIYGDNNTYFTESNVNDSIIGNTNITDSDVLFADLYNCTVIESNVSHVYGRNCLIRGSNVRDNSTIIDSEVINSTVDNSTITNSTLIDTTSTNSTVDNSTIMNSTLTNFIINDANITDNWIYNGTISQDGFTYNATQDGSADITTLFEYIMNTNVLSPTNGASYVAGTTVIFSADTSNLNRWNATRNYTASWNFGDGQTSNTVNTTHIYANAGTITATLILNDTIRVRNFYVTFTLTANCSDGVRNQNENSVDTGGVCSPSSGGGGGGGTLYKLNILDFTNSCDKDIRLGNGDRLRVTIDGTNYQYSQTAITNDLATLYGNGQELIVDLNSKTGYDLNNDGKNDVYITLTTIENKVGSYTIELMNCELTGTINQTLPETNQSTTTPTTGTNNQSTTTPTEGLGNQTTNQTGTPTGMVVGVLGLLSNWLWALIALLLVLIILGLLYWLIFGRKKEEKKPKNKKTKKNK